jgi:hypothetical protein
MSLESEEISDASIGEKVVIRDTIKLIIKRIDGDFAVVCYTLHGQDLELKLPKNMLAVDQDAAGSGWLA